MDEQLDLMSTAWRALRAALNSGRPAANIVETGLAIIQATDDAAALRETAQQAPRRIEQLRSNYETKDARVDRELDERFDK